MSEFWRRLKKSFCKPCCSSSEVDDPKGNTHHRNAKNKGKSNCSKSEASKAMLKLNPVTHEIFLDDTSGEIEIHACYPCCQKIEGVVGSRRPTKPTIASRKTHFVDCGECSMFSKQKEIVLKDSHEDPPTLTFTCQQNQCLDAIEEQNISEHSVIQLERQDSSWRIIKRICESSYVTGESKGTHIECILKVSNTQDTFACFEKCREMVKKNVESQQNAHPRCLVDGNELLMFHGTTIACSLGISGSSDLCTLDQCGLCQILRHGFSANQDFHGTTGVFTTSTCAKAIEFVCSSNRPFTRMCVIVGRVIAGRINSSLQDNQEMNHSRYDSLVKKISDQLDIEELNVLNPAAILPCFAVIYRFSES